MKYYFFIANIIAKTKQNLLLSLSFNTLQSCLQRVITNNSQIDRIKEYLKQNEKSNVHVHVLCCAINE